MRTQLIVPPVDEPLELEEVRQHLRNPESTGEIADEELYQMIQSAREWVEHKTGYALLTQTWDVYLDGFPSNGFSAGYSFPAYAAVPIPLPYPPLQSVTSVTYSGTAFTGYTVNNSGPQASIIASTWPTISGTLTDSVVIRIVVGWQDPEFIPASIKSWMKLAIESMDKARGLSQEREPFLSPYADRLLDRYRILSV